MNPVIVGLIKFDTASYFKEVCYYRPIAFSFGNVLNKKVKNINIL